MITITEIIFLLSISSIISFLILKKLYSFLTKYFLKNPNKRDSHIVPTPTSGGIIFVFSSYFMILYQRFDNPELTNIVLASTPIAIIGIIDDRFDIGRLVRYVIQVCTSIFLFLIHS